MDRAARGRGGGADERTRERAGAVHRCCPESGERPGRRRGTPGAGVPGVGRPAATRRGHGPAPARPRPAHGGPRAEAGAGPRDRAGRGVPRLTVRGCRRRGPRPSTAVTLSTPSTSRDSAPAGAGTWTTRTERARIAARTLREDRWWTGPLITGVGLLPVGVDPARRGLR